MKIAIIGAGFSGCLIAQQLQQYGHEVELFEKARGVGGRMSTRYADKFCFDHGAQCFTATRAPFKAFVEEMQAMQAVAEWKGKVITFHENGKLQGRVWRDPHWVGTPNMNSPVKHLARGLNIHLQALVQKIEPVESRWSIKGEGFEYAGFDHVIITAPPKQAIEMLNEVYQPQVLRGLKMHSTYCLMLGFDKPWWDEYIAGKIINSKVKWLSINSSKPGRDAHVTSIVAHAHQSWSNKHLEADQQWVQSEMLAELKIRADLVSDDASYISLHRWRYAVVAGNYKGGPIIDLQKGLSFTSDWAYTSRIEEVYEAAMAVVSALR